MEIIIKLMDAIPPHGEDSVSRTINFIVHCFEMDRLLRIH